MKKRILCLILTLAMLFVGACSNGSDTKTDAGSTDVKIDGDSASVKQMKEYNMLYSSEPKYNYLVTWAPDRLDLMVDGLVEFDKYGVLVPSMATEWSKSEDGLVYTFKIREDQKWYTNDGKEYADVTADDFLTSAKYMLTEANSALQANLIYDFIVNAKEYFNGEITDFSQVGIKAVDKYTLEYTLKTPCTYFLKLAGNSAYYPANQKFLDEVGDKFGTAAENLLFNGAYVLSTWLPEDRQVFEFNENYWNKDNIFISKITSIFNKDTSLQGELFQRGEIDQASIPAELMQEWVNDTEDKGKWAIRNFYKPSGWFWTINVNPRYEGNGVEDFKIAVNNVSFRKSLYFALDRVAIAETLEMWTPENKVLNTVVPRSILNVNGIDYTQVGDLKAISDSEPFDVKKALEFKETAMKELDGKVKFPITLLIPYNSGNKDFVNAAQVFDQQMENALGTDYIDIVLEAHPPTSFNTLVYGEGIYSIGYNFWGADYADPATFTDVFNPKLKISGRYGQPFLSEGYEDSNGEHKYVNLLEDALSENSSVEKRYEKLAKAEAFLINEALVIPNIIGDGIWWLCKLDPHEGNTFAFGRDVSCLKGKKVLDNPMTRDEYLKAEEEYLKEQQEAFKNAKNQN